MKDNVRNPPGTPASQWRWKYYRPSFYQQLGQLASQCSCFMVGKGKLDRDEEEEEIPRLLAEE